MVNKIMPIILTIATVIGLIVLTRYALTKAPGTVRSFIGGIPILGGLFVPYNPPKSTSTIETGTGLATV